MNLQAKDGSAIRGWLTLLRPPNLLTIPGDALAGFVLAWPMHTGHLPDLMAAIGAGLFFYMAGLVINDLADVAIDQRERPRRPLASGVVKLGAAKNAAAIFLGAGLILAGSRSMPLLAAGAGLGALILAYNLYAKKSRMGGALVMGLCRAGSVALGVVAGSSGALMNGEVLLTLVWWTAFIGSISWLAAREMTESPYGFDRWLPMLVVAGFGIAALVLSRQAEQQIMRGLLCIIFSAGICWQGGFLLGMKPYLPARDKKAVKTPRYPLAIGQLISAIIPMQAAAIVLHASEPWMLLAGLLVLLCWPLNRWQAKIFSAS